MIESPYISPQIAASKYFFKHEETIRRLCREGFFKHARKPTGKNGQWQLLRTEVIAKVGKPIEQ